MSRPSRPVRTHRVQDGETLATISKLYYGTDEFIGLIYNHNGHYIKDPNKLYRGQVIVIPHIPIRALI